MITISQFQEEVWDYYARNGRDLPWRHSDKDGTYDPYKIMVSEIMLQQTQVQRVIKKYQEFLDNFPTVNSLAKSQFADVLRVWHGLGYNRRAKFLLEAAKQVVSESRGRFPEVADELVKLPGVGKNTAAAICAYAYNQPVVFIETNIRTVFIHSFFAGQEMVSDTDLMPYIEQALDTEEPRQWYWALMDYGSHLKQTVGNAGRQSKHYVRQSAFQGSKRQLRAAVLTSLLGGDKTTGEIKKTHPDERLDEVLQALTKEQLITKKNNIYHLS